MDRPALIGRCGIHHIGQHIEQVIKIQRGFLGILQNVIIREIVRGEGVHLCADSACLDNDAVIVLRRDLNQTVRQALRHGDCLSGNDEALSLCFRGGDGDCVLQIVGTQPPIADQDALHAGHRRLGRNYLLKHIDFLNQLGFVDFHIVLLIEFAEYRF